MKESQWIFLFVNIRYTMNICWGGSIVEQDGVHFHVFEKTLNSFSFLNSPLPRCWPLSPGDLWSSVIMCYEGEFRC